MVLAKSQVALEQNSSRNKPKDPCLGAACLSVLPAKVVLAITGASQKHNIIDKGIFLCEISQQKTAPNPQNTTIIQLCQPVTLATFPFCPILLYNDLVEIPCSALSEQVEGRGLRTVIPGSIFDWYGSLPVQRQFRFALFLRIK